MKTDTLPAIVTVQAEAFKRFLSLRSQANAIQKEAETARKECGLPETADLVKQLGLSEANPKGEVVIFNGNNQPIGKIAVSFRDAYTVAGTFVSRVS